MDRITLIVLLFSSRGCVSIHGGAVDASWVVETYGDGRTIADCGCACPPIAKVRLQLTPLSGDNAPDPCSGNETCQFSCNLQSGATRFEIPPGSYAMLLVPVGADGNDISPGNPLTCGSQSGVDPQVWDVVKGQVTQLNAVLMQATCAADCGGSDTRNVCTK